jgi:hypothetical protein
MFQVSARRKSKRRRSKNFKTPILPSIGGISVVKKDKKFMSGGREELSKSVNKEKSLDNPSVAVKLEEENVVMVNARQLETLFSKMKSQREQATSWGSLRSRLTNSSMRNPLTSAKVKNDARSNIYILNITLSMINNLAKNRFGYICKITQFSRPLPYANPKDGGPKPSKLPFYRALVASAWSRKTISLCWE